MSVHKEAVNSSSVETIKDFMAKMYLTKFRLTFHPVLGVGIEDRRKGREGRGKENEAK